MSLNSIWETRTRDRISGSSKYKWEVKLLRHELSKKRRETEVQTPTDKAVGKSYLKKEEHGKGCEGKKMQGVCKQWEEIRETSQEESFIPHRIPVSTSQNHPSTLNLKW